MSSKPSLQQWLNGSKHERWSKVARGIERVGTRALVWSDQSPNWRANVYLGSLLRKGKQASSVRTYASDLSVAMRFLEETRLDIDQVCDESLVDLRSYLVKRSKCDSNHINRIIHRFLLFLVWYQSFWSLKVPLVGGEGSGAPIHYEEEQPSGRQSHPAFLPSVAPSIVRPMSRDALKQLRNAVPKVFKRRFARARAHALLTLLGDSGCRRQEAVWVTVKDIEDALRDPRSLLKLRTAKRQGHPIREVPVPRVTLLAVSQYISVERRLVQRRTRKRSDALFITESGSRISPETVTQMFAKLRRKSGLSSKACAHMLRHRWITLQLIERIKEYKGMGLSHEIIVTVLTRLASLSGHSSFDGMWGYVDFAFDELTGGRVETSVPRRLQLEAIERILATVQSERSSSRSMTKQQQLLSEATAVLLDVLRQVKEEFPSEAIDSFVSRGDAATRRF